jgi:hypothetical protein
MDNSTFALFGVGLDLADLGSKTSSAFTAPLFKNQQVITTTHKQRAGAIYQWQLVKW